MPRSSSTAAMRRFSSTEKSTPVVCAPSRSVVSNRYSRSLLISITYIRSCALLPRRQTGRWQSLRPSRTASGLWSACLSASPSSRSLRAGGAAQLPRRHDLARLRVLGILQRDAHRRELVADAIALLEVLGLPRLEAFSDELLHALRQLRLRRLENVGALGATAPTLHVEAEERCGGKPLLPVRIGAALGV